MLALTQPRRRRRQAGRSPPTVFSAAVSPPSPHVTRTSDTSRLECPAGARWGPGRDSPARRRRVHTCTSRPDFALGPGPGARDGLCAPLVGGLLLWGQGDTSFLPEHGALRTQIDPLCGLSVLNTKGKVKLCRPPGLLFTPPADPAFPRCCSCNKHRPAFWRNPLVLGSSGTVIKCSLCRSEREDRSQQAPTWGRFKTKCAQ